MNFGIQFSFTADISRVLWGRGAQPHPQKYPRDRSKVEFFNWLSVFLILI